MSDRILRNTQRKEAVDLGEVGFVELPGATVGPAANTAVPSAKSLHAVATRQEIPTSLHPPTRLTAIVDVGGVHCRSPWDNSLSRASCSGRILWSHISLPGLTARSCAPPSKRRGLLLIVLAAMGVALAVG